LLDEIDALITKKHDIVYNLFNWPTFPGSRLIVIAIANTQNLPETMLAKSIASRLGISPLHFV
jgi:origin recognition complex subunit 1